MSILEFLVDNVVSGFQWIVKVLDWVAFIIVALAELFQLWYPWNMIIGGAGAVLMIKTILRGGK